ncbi:Crocetin glucosyltransferase [Actinidia chinensis var. chinensis]|uniref:Glycosyltransferase n=1 Tax=Actinidia chinensis var. chinensis TaxID=1590841 RepID=A0A2R6RX28_ACTCC|nr:Crocetin glucosyltransferase [Actinidia chinensis var. chinensis]
MEDCRHILVVTFPGQGHINPSLQFAKRVVKMGVKVTFLTALCTLNRMPKTAVFPQGLSFSGFSNAFVDGWTSGYISETFMAEMKKCSSEAVAKHITSSAEKGQPVIHVVYTTLVPWVGQVANALHVPSTSLWIQPATLLDIYYYYFHGYGDIIGSKINDPSWSIDLPGLPRLTGRDLPSFLSSSDPYDFTLPLFKQHFDTRDEETKLRILVNSFDALEPEALRAIEKLDLVAVGPFIPSAFLDGKDSSDTSFGGDLFKKSEDYVEWLNANPKASVVYVAFGSYSELSKQQMEEIARGLLETRRPFLWVVREEKNGEREEEKPSWREEAEQHGMIVPWCSQVEVLSHPSLGCFVSHCGWNSSLESLVCGVPVVGIPQWTDQVTNAKLIEDVWKTGVRTTRNEQGMVESGEIKKCIEIVMQGEEMRRNAKKWRIWPRKLQRKVDRRTRISRFFSMKS